MSRPRVGLVGARQRRQGLGPFVARDLVQAGAGVPCFVTTSTATRDAAIGQLAATCGVEARGYLDVDEMLARERLDALAILSPAETHAAYLEAALAAGLHVLCEKPLVWGRPDLAATTARLVDVFDRAGLLLWENCQWPYTLPAYEHLFPGALRRPPERFFMLMQPTSAGVQAFADSLPHTLSLLQALVPGEDPTLVDPRFAVVDPERGEQTVAFRYRTDRWSARVDVRLKPASAFPREAAFALDGRLARRRVESESYRLSFTSDDDRSVPLDDPMTLLIADFVGELREARSPSKSRGIAERMALLGQLVDARGRLGREEAGEAGR
jgi:predicted dehydrogenase